MVYGVGAISYSLLTRYPFGIVRLIPMSVHVAIDVIASTIVAASPWLFGFADEVYGPHLVFGAAGVAVALVTRRPGIEHPMAPQAQSAP